MTNWQTGAPTTRRFLSPSSGLVTIYYVNFIAHIIQRYIPKVTPVLEG